MNGRVLPHDTDIDDEQAAIDDQMETAMQRVLQTAELQSLAVMLLSSVRRSRFRCVTLAFPTLALRYILGSAV